MKPLNIVSVCNSNKLNILDLNLTKGFKMSQHETETMEKFINLLKEYGADSMCFSGFYVGYSIEQVSKEFDLLRFSNKSVINIELKSSLEEATKVAKITHQMKHNMYYLKFLERDVHIFTYIEDDGLYTLDFENDTVISVEVSQLVKLLREEITNYNLCPNNMFVPSNYLISVFNNAERFLKGEYFLTDHQLNIKKEILNNLEKGIYKMYCISANAGTGKTLLAYDIARHIISCNSNPLIIHCGKLNAGHQKLSEVGWNVYSVRSIKSGFVDTWRTMSFDIIIIDETHRISSSQLDLIINKSLELKVPAVFMYDTNQYLRTGETKEISEYIKNYYKDIPLIKLKLTNKIRTNKEMASFIKNLTRIGSSKAYLDYKDITIEYFSSFEDIADYIDELSRTHGWKAITFTTSMYNQDPLDKISGVCESNAHDVIGQEFRKVVFVMDSNFKYGEDGSLLARRTYYSAEGMLYQIVTRVVEELKIIVFDNSELFEKLLTIKHRTFM